MIQSAVVAIIQDKHIYSFYLSVSYISAMFYLMQLLGATANIYYVDIMFEL